MNDALRDRLQECYVHAIHLQNELQQANAISDPVTNLLILRMIEKAAKLEADIEALIGAMDAGKTPKAEQPVKNCSTCKHEDRFADLAPCAFCSQMTEYTELWEPK